jgi:hypothetical protein
VDELIARVNVDLDEATSGSEVFEEAITIEGVDASILGDDIVRVDVSKLFILTIQVEAKVLFHITSIP